MSHLQSPGSGSHKAGLRSEGVYQSKLTEKYIGMGAWFILNGSDISFIMARARERTTVLRGLKH